MPGREMPMALDFAGEIYIRQEGGAMLMGPVPFAIAQTGGAIDLTWVCCRVRR